MSENAITIRPACADDILPLSNIHFTSWQNTYQGFMPEFCALTPQAYFVDIWTAHFKNPKPGSFSLIAEKAEEALGLVRAGPASSDKISALRERNGADICTANMGELYQLYLTPQAQGHGLGRLLYNATLASLRMAGFKSMIIDVYSKNARALGFYEAHGAKIALHFDDNETRENQSFAHPSVLMLAAL